MYQRAGELGLRRGVEGVGRCKNCRADYKTALKLYLISRSMEGNEISSEGELYNNVGHCYYNLRKVDVLSARRWFRKGEQLGNPTAKSNMIEEW